MKRWKSKPIGIASIDQDIFEAITQHSFDLIAIFDESGHYKFCNRSYQTLLGYDPDKLIGTSGLNLFLKEEREANFNLIIDGLKGQSAEAGLTARIVNSKGEIRWVEHRFRVIEGTFGSDSRILMIARDITQATEAAEAAKDSAEVLRIIAENAFHWEFWESKEGIFAYHSPACYQITGYTNHELLKDQGLFMQIIHEDDRAHFKQHRARAHSDHGSHSLQFRILSKSGEVRILEHLCNAVFNSSGQYMGIRGTNIDITEREEERLLLEQSEAKLKRLYDNMAQGVVYQDEKGNIISANHSAERILGLSLDQMMGRTSADPRWHAIRENGSPFPGNEHPAMVSLGTGVPSYALMGVFNPRNNCYSWINVNAIPEFRNGEKDPFQVVTTFEDITAIRETYYELSKMNKRLSMMRNIDFLINSSGLEDPAVTETALKGLLKLVPCHEIHLFEFDYNLKIAKQMFKLDPGGLCAKTGVVFPLDVFNLDAMNPTVKGISAVDFSKLDASSQKRIRDKGFKDSISVPLRSADRVFGVFVLLALENNSFNREHWEIAEDFATQISLSMKRKELLGKLTNQTQELELQVEQRTVEIKRLSSLNHAVLKNAGLAIISTDEEGTIRTFNPAAETMLGYKLCDVIGKVNVSRFIDHEELKSNRTELSLISGDTVRPDFSVFKSILSIMPVNTGEWTFIRKDGSRVPVRMTISELEEYGGVGFGYVLIAMDITEEKASLGALLKSEERFSNMFRDHSAVMFLVDPLSGRIVEMNNAARSYYGYDFSRSEGLDIAQINIQDRSEILKEMQKAKGSTKNIFHFRHKLANGDIRDVEVHSTPIEMRGETLLFSIVQDVTESLETQKMLRASEEEKRAILMAVPDSIFRISRDGVFLSCQQSSVRITELRDEEIVGKTITDIVSPEYQGIALEAIQVVCEKQETRIFEFGDAYSEKVIENRILPFADHQVLSILRDVTDIRRKDRILRWNENLLRMMASSSPLAFLVVDNRTDKILYFNSQFCEIWRIQNLEAAMREGHYKNNDIIPFCIGVLSDVDAFAESCKPLQDEHNQAVIEDVIPFNDGRFIRRFSSQIRDEQNAYYGRLYIFEDITHRKSTEKLLRLQKDLAVKISGISDTTEIFSLCLETVLKFTIVDGAGIYLIDPETQDLKLEAHKGLSDEFVRSVSCFHKGTVQYEKVMQGTPAFYDYRKFSQTELAAEGLQHIGVIPVIHEGQVQGCLNVGTKNPEGFHPTAMDSLIALGLQIGGAITRVRGEEALKSSRENFKLLFDTIDDFLFILDTTGNIIFTNPVVPRRLGYSDEELSGKNVLMVHPPERREEAGFIVGEMLAGREEFCPGPLIKKDGERIPVETRVVMGKWDGKDVLFGISRDITERQKAEAELRKQTAAFESFALPIIITDPNAKIQWSNSAFKTHSGYTWEEMKGQKVGDLVRSGKQTPEFYHLLWKTIKSGKIWTGELINRRKDGSLFDEELTITPLFDHTNEINGFIAIKIDITFRKIMERALRESEARWNFALEGSGDGVWDWNISENKVYYSKQWKTMLGYQENEISDTLEVWKQLVHPEDLSSCLAELESHFRKEKEVYTTEHRVLCKDGFYKWILDRGKVIEWDEEGKPVRAIGTHTDITHLKNMEQGLRDAVEREKELNELKSKFISVASHEFRTPLATILAASESLMAYRDKMTGEQVDDRLKKVKTQVKNLSNIIDEVLNLSRMEKLEKAINEESFDLSFTILSLIQEFKIQTGGSREILFSSTPELIEITSDRFMIHQIFSNLISNALKYSGSEMPVRVSLQSENGNVIVKVKDNGIGIPENNLKHLFDPFFRASNSASYAGTGLGLNIVKETLERLGGEIRVESSLDQGSCFEVILPLNLKEINITRKNEENSSD
jgi:PAS domain S-box-containing protein